MKWEMAVARVAAPRVRWPQRITCRTVPLGTLAAFHLTKGMPPEWYPRTPEGQAPAAKKYNIPVEDLQAVPRAGMGQGDHPKLPDRS